MYAYLTVSRTPCDLIRFADGSERALAAGQGEAAAEAWVGEAASRAAASSGESPDAAPARAQAAYEAAVAEWEAELDRRSDHVRSIAEARAVRGAFEAER